MIRGTRPLLIALAAAPLPGALQAQEGLALTPPAAMPATKTQPKTRLKVRSKAKGFVYRKAEADNARAMRWTCVGCTDRQRLRPDAGARAQDPNGSDEPVIADPARAPVID